MFTRVRGTCAAPGNEFLRVLFQCFQQCFPAREICGTALSLPAVCCCLKEVILKGLGRVHKSQGHDGNAALFGNLEAALMKGQEGIVYPVAGAFGEDALLAEWIVGKFNPGLKARSSMALVSWGFRCITVLAGTRVIVKGLERGRCRGNSRF